MKEINEKDAAKLVSMIYRPSLKEEWQAIDGEHTVRNLIYQVEAEMATQSANDIFSGEMTKKEYQDIINQIKSSDTLMKMKIVKIEDNASTDFCAMTLKDPDNQINPVIVFRGTAGNYQWDDNLAGMLSTRTPSQQEAQEYVVKSGYDHLTVAGHSKGGNMAASMAYLLPEGMVDKVYSFDGQGASNMFLANIPYKKKEYAKERVFNINEYRDIVSQLMNKTGDDKNTTYFDSGVDFKDTEYASNYGKMYLFHPHKPNYFLTEDVKNTGRSFVPSRWAHGISELDLSILPKVSAIWTAKHIAKILYGNDKTAWSEKMWNAVYDAEKSYQKVNSEREKTILSKLSELYQVDFSKYDLVQEDGSFVVEGAVLTCQFCSGAGTLENIENHGHVIQNKAVASVKDNKTGENICINSAECSVIKYASQPLDTEPHNCSPIIVNEWVITDSNKKVTVSGEAVDAVLKKSALGCLNGGMIVVAYNGQMEMQDAVKKNIWDDVKSRAARAVAAIGKTIKENNPLQKEKDKLDLFIDGAETIKNIIQNAEAPAVDGPAQNYEELKKQIENVRDEYIEKLINNRIQMH